MKHIKEYAVFESGWDSAGEFGDGITINGIKVETEYVAIYDTPNFISYEIRFQADKTQLHKIGIWSNEYADEIDADDEPKIMIYSISKELPISQMKKLHIDTVKDLEDSDVYDYFEKDITKNIKDSYSGEELLASIKKYDGREDWILTTPEQQSGYKLLNKIKEK